MTDATSTIETPSGKGMETENFPVASLLVRADLRKHVHAYYIFARAADDISDNPDLTPAEKVARLDRFEKALLDDTDMSVPSVVPLRESLKETGVAVEHATDLLKAFRRDSDKLRYRDWADLMDYCRYSAAPVGRYVLALHGIDDEVWPANDALCAALQVINHLQDCGEDYRLLDRVYLPDDMMARFGTKAEELALPKSSLALRETMIAMLDEMEPLMELARGFPSVVSDFRLRMEVSVIVSLAESMVAVLQKRDPLCEYPKPCKAQKLYAVARGLLRAVL